MSTCLPRRSGECETLRWALGRGVDEETNTRTKSTKSLNFPFICHSLYLLPHPLPHSVLFSCFLLTFSLLLSLKKKKRGKHEKWPSWSSWKVINGQREFCLLSPLLILCGIKTPLCQSPSALVGVKALQYIKAPLGSVLPVCGGRAYSSTQSLALSKSCMGKSMQSLTEYTKDYRIWVRRKTHSAHILAHF